MIKEPEAPAVAPVEIEELPPLETDLERNMRLWLEALEGGDYKQTRGALYRQVGGTAGYCCLGVADEAVFGATFRCSFHDAVWRDDEDETTHLAHTRQRALGLDKLATRQAGDIAQAMGLTRTAFAVERSFTVEGSGPTRGALLMIANDDDDASFGQIATFIRKCGWDREESVD